MVSCNILIQNEVWSRLQLSCSVYEATNGPVRFGLIPCLLSTRNGRRRSPAPSRVISITREGLVKTDQPGFPYQVKEESSFLDLAEQSTGENHVSSSAKNSILAYLGRILRKSHSQAVQSAVTAGLKRVVTGVVGGGFGCTDEIVDCDLYWE